VVKVKNTHLPNRKLSQSSAK